MKVEEPKHGIKREAVKHYFYVTEGLNFLNAFRYLIMCIMALYAFMHMDNPMIMVIMFAIAIPCLDVLGWIAVNHVKKPMEYFNVKKATSYGMHGYNLQERQVFLLEAMCRKMGLTEEELKQPGQNG